MLSEGTHSLVEIGNRVLLLYGLKQAKKPADRFFTLFIMGPEFILVNISVDINDTTSADNVESTIAKLDRTVKKKFPHVKRIFIEAEKCKS